MNLKYVSGIGFCALALCSCGGNKIDYGKTYSKEEFKTKVLAMYDKTEPFDSTTNSTYKKLTGKIKWDFSGTTNSVLTNVKMTVATFILGPTASAEELKKKAEELDTKNSNGIEIPDSSTNTLLIEPGVYYIDKNGDQYDKVENYISIATKGIQADLTHSIKGNRSSFYVKLDDVSSKLSSDYYKVEGSFEESFSYGFDDEALKGYGYISRIYGTSNMTYTNKSDSSKYTVKQTYEIDYTVSK